MKAVNLYAPEGYWRLPADERKKLYCGPGRGVIEWLVPDTCYGLDIQPACSIHDYMYAVGETEADKNEADAVFLNNLVRIIQACTTNKMVLKLRLRRARTYWWSVHTFGGPAFWNHKDQGKRYMPVMLRGAA